MQLNKLEFHILPSRVELYHNFKQYWNVHCCDFDLFNQRSWFERTCQYCIDDTSKRAIKDTFADIGVVLRSYPLSYFSLKKIHFTETANNQVQFNCFLV